MADEPKTAAGGSGGPTPPRTRNAAPADRPPGPWKHADGCTNPNSTQWDCLCGPEVIPE